MRRLLPLLLLSAILLGACSPTVTLFTHEPEASPTVGTPSAPLPATQTPVPTPTHAPDLGISPEALKGVEVVLWHGWDGTSASLFAQMAAEFNLSNKWGIKVNVRPQLSLNLLADEVEKALRSPEQPDLVVALPEQILAWQDKVLDLTPYAAQPEFGLDPNDFPAALWGQSVVNGVRNSLPAARSARFLFYNVSFARELGFTAPPQTADEFRKQACAANAFWKRDQDLTNDGFGGLALETDSNWQTPYAWLAAAGGQVFVDGEFRFNTPDNLAALDFISTLRSDGCAWLSTSPTSYEALATRKALFFSGSLNEIDGQKAAMSAATADEWTLLPFPGRLPAVVAYGPDYAVFKSSPARQLAAWLFIRWMLEPQNQARWSRETGLLPVTLSAAKTLKAENTTNPQRSAALDLLTKTVPYPQTAHWQLASKVLGDGFQAYIVNFPNASLEAILKLMDKTVQDLTKP
jgi:ABC-type glycerol-3-phosphate transport system substrate-binding protein